MEKDKNPLPIPVNCPPIPYVIQGLTRTDMSILGICGGIVLVLAIVIYTKTDAVKAVVFFFFVMAVAVLIVFRDAYTENMIDKLRVLRRYQKSQKHFIYTYVDEIWLQAEKLDKGAQDGEKNG